MSIKDASRLIFISRNDCFHAPYYIFKNIDTRQTSPPDFQATDARVIINI